MLIRRRRRFFKRVYGYHGTSKQRASVIRKNGFKGSSNSYDWLGDGVYFWQDAPSRAREWAEQHHPHDPAVIGVRMTLSPNCMDLLDIDWWLALEDAHRQLLEEAERTETAVPRQRSDSLAHRLDSAVINYSIQLARSQGLNVPAVRAAFIEGRPVYPNSAIHNRSHVQICVVDNTIIDDVFEVR